ncbi:hypothetical protein [Mycoplasma sp. 1018B]|uniref:hypothetical protein n=1 Tax=Mycoplasma sp. 1018B TaxID=2967302 RepID=UPI00211BB80D|nr:hypothetical protein [Mycoplasma sp. 1018B]UUM19010.1 hypothetical protein NPA14_01565 [Mycoplasma sp. 1018B]
MFSFIASFSYFIIIPFVSNGQTLGMIFTRLQYINLYNNEKNKLFLIVLKRAIFNFFLYVLISLIILCLIYPWDLELFKNFINSITNKENKITYNVKIIIIYRIITTLITLNLLLISAHYVSLLIKKNKVGILDYLCSSRVVLIKHYNLEKFNKEVKLIPFKHHNKKYHYIEEKR